MGHEHSHGPADERALARALALIVGFMAAEIVAAVIAHSLALLADAGHMLTDAAAIAVALWASRLSQRPTSSTWTFGLKRAEILAAAVNGVTLLIVGGVVLVAAIQRLVHPGDVTGSLVLVVALAGIVVNAAAVYVLAGAGREKMHLRGAFQHVLTDAIGFGATAVSAVVVITAGYRRADAIASLFVVALMVAAAWRLLRDSGRVLLEGTPQGVDLDHVRQQLLAADHHVRDVHDLHAWLVTTSLPAISAHVVLDESCFVDGHAAELLDRLQAALIGEFDVEHSTLQLEMPAHVAHEIGAHH